MGVTLLIIGVKTMAKDLTSPATLADQALEQMFGYYGRQTETTRRPANDSNRVISELDAAGAILAAKRAA